MQRRLILLLVALLLLSGGAALLWTALDLPPPLLLLRYGFSPECEPTGRVRNVEGIEFVEIGPGCFRMGSEFDAHHGDLLGRVSAALGLSWGDPPRGNDEMPVHWVEFRNGFWIAKTEVINARFDPFRKRRPKPYRPDGAHQPAVLVSWDDAKDWCDRLAEKSGLPIRLPSEAEWECACRAGRDTEFHSGDDEGRLREHAWFKANAEDLPEVGTRAANAWGLLDLHGGVFEWCADTYHKSYHGAPTDGTAWKEGGSKEYRNSPARVYRGGSWKYPADYSRSALRLHGPQRMPSLDIGFRPAFTLPAED